MVLRHLPQPRPGKIALAVLILLPMLMLCVALGIFSSQAVETRTTLQNNTDADALAAVQGLVDDDMLTGNEAAARRVLAQSHEQARLMALENPVHGQPLELLPNPKNEPFGDVVHGFLDWPKLNQFALADLKDHGNSLHLVNCVRVTGQRTRERGTAVPLLGGPFLTHVPTDLTCYATAMLDRQVVGLRPLHNKPLPLVPLGIRSDRTSQDERSWEHQVGRKRGPDNWAFNREQQQFFATKKGDGLHEIELTFDADKPEVCLLQMGQKKPQDLVVQIAEGVTTEQLKDFGGEFVLGQDNEKVAPGAWKCGKDSSLEAALIAGLDLLRRSGEVRVWPLFDHQRAYQGMPLITGFVAARVVALSRDDETGQLKVTLSPAMICTATAVTAFAEGRGPATPSNPYVCKARLVE